ncbi:MAG: hypothetical protein DRR19_06015 [Candidatus Parabeggiatoa sp. nov. 1]|nr:MAG: hypothetical protein DRR19_06015 [Gammaproteobacteria bacterium]
MGNVRKITPNKPTSSKSFSTQHEHPIFCFKYLDRNYYSLGACTKEEKAAFADTLDRLSQLTWAEISKSHRHGLGYEKIARNSIRATIPTHVKEDVIFIAFRFYGKAPMVGYRTDVIFHILWIYRDFTLYQHS